MRPRRRDTKAWRYGSTYRHRPVAHIEPTKTLCVPSDVTATLFGPHTRPAGNAALDHVVPGWSAV